MAAGHYNFVIPATGLVESRNVVDQMIRATDDTSKHGAKATALIASCGPASTKRCVDEQVASGA